jgi:YbbR domain-containing protein
MGNFFDRENMLARVIAFLIACALWMYVMNEQNPLVERNYVVNLELRNVPEGMYLILLIKCVLRFRLKERF